MNTKEKYKAKVIKEYNDEFEEFINYNLSVKLWAKTNRENLKLNFKNTLIGILKEIHNQSKFQYKRSLLITKDTEISDVKISPLMYAAYNYRTNDYKEKELIYGENVKVYVAIEFMLERLGYTVKYTSSGNKWGIFITW